MNHKNSTVPAIGEAIWYFDDTVREYESNGYGGSKIIWRAKWLCGEVVSENKVSIFVKTINNSVLRTSKAEWRNGDTPESFARSEADVDAHCWARDHHFAVGARTSHATPAQLAAIANILNYQEPEGTLPRPEHLKFTKNT